MIVGKYVNMNYHNEFIGENPHVEDTLEIHPNGKFYSPFFGEGEYKLSYSFKGTRISLKPYSKMGLNTSIDRNNLIGKPRINLFRDLNQYYKKID
jgi:hypothetical protein